MPRHDEREPGHRLDIENASVGFARGGPFLLGREGVAERAEVPGATFAIAFARLEDHVLEQKPSIGALADLLLGDEPLRLRDGLKRFPLRLGRVPRLQELDRFFVQEVGPLREKDSREEQGRVHRRGSGLREPHEPLRRRVESLDLLAEREPELLLPSLRTLIEARAGDCGDADGLDEMSGEGHVVGKAEGRDIGHDVVGPARHEAPESRRAQAGQERVPAVLIVPGESLVVRVRKPQRFRRRFLERRRRAHGQEIVHLADGARQLRRSQRPSHPPSGHRVGLGDAVDGDGALRHSVEARERNVLRVVVEDVLVDLVGDGDDPPLLAEPGDVHELVSGKDLTRGVVGRINNDGPGLRVEGGIELVGIEAPVGLPESHVAGDRSRQDGIRPVVLVERLEHDHLVAGVDEGEQGGDHRLGGAAGDGHLALGIDLHSVGEAVPRADRVPELFRAPGDGVLVDVLAHRGDRRLFDLGVGGEIGKALGEVDRVVLLGEPRHLPDDGLGELERFP